MTRPFERHTFCLDLPTPAPRAVVRIELARPTGKESLSPNELSALGRDLLSSAVVHCGGPDQSLVESTDRGAPVVPYGFVGSVSHKPLRVVAAAAKAPVGVHLGIDIEEVKSPVGSIESRILADEELPIVSRLSGQERDAVLLRTFSMKEAIYKAIDPFCRRYVGFKEVSVLTTSVLPAAGFDEYVAERSPWPPHFVWSRPAMNLRIPIGFDVQVVVGSALTGSSYGFYVLSMAAAWKVCLTGATRS